MLPLAMTLVAVYFWRRRDEVGAGYLRGRAWRAENPMRCLLASLSVLLSSAALAQTPLSPPKAPTQPQLAPQTPLAPGAQLAPATQAPLPPQQSGPSLSQPQLPAEQPPKGTPQLAPPAPAALAPLSQPGPQPDGGASSSSPAAPPSPPAARRDGGP